MKLIIGTYRKQQYLPAALESIHKHVTGISKIVFVDDSGDATHHDWLRDTYGGRVVDTRCQGYGAAMQAACREGAGEDYAMWTEEDFTFTGDVDVKSYERHLQQHPYLAQVVFLRQPWFENEIAAGGLIPALEAKGHTFTEVNGLLEQEATFSGNPSIWRREVFASGWPTCEWSEDAKRDELLRDGYKFAFTPREMTHHHGIRSGFGY